MQTVSTLASTGLEAHAGGRTTPMKRLVLLSLALVSLVTACSTWHYRTTSDRSVVYGRSGQSLSIRSGATQVQFTVPPGWKVVSPLDEPCDWDWAADAPSGQLSFGVRLEPSKQTLSMLERHQAFLANVHKSYDPKIRLERTAPYTIANGQSVPAYLYTSAYWGQRTVVIIPEGANAVTFEFSSNTSKTTANQRTAIQQILGTYSEKK